MGVSLLLIKTSRLIYVDSLLNEGNIKLEKRKF